MGRSVRVQSESRVDGPSTPGSSPRDFLSARDRIRGRRPSVLVVDDEREIVDLLQVVLEDEGYRVVPAFDGEQAWRLAHVEPPDLVISDVMMPRLSGVELVGRLRDSRERLAKTPVILMSAADRTPGDGRVTFLPKPFDLDRMLSLVSTELAAS